MDTLKLYSWTVCFGWRMRGLRFGGRKKKKTSFSPTSSTRDKTSILKDEEICQCHARKIVRSNPHRG